MQAAGLEAFVAHPGNSIISALSKIDANRMGFVIVTDETSCKVLGVLTDGDVRRALIKGCDTDAPIDGIYTTDCAKVSLNEGFERVTELFKNPAVKFLPILDEDGRLVNMITKPQFHAFLLQDIHSDLGWVFLSLDTSILDSEIHNRPWGFYKTTVLNDYYQAKVISIHPGGELSLQSHQHREEFWVVVHGSGTVQVGDDSWHISCGSNIHIPKGERHRVSNTDPAETLIISEIQIGDYLGEDDIIRYEDKYGRT